VTLEINRHVHLHMNRVIKLENVISGIPINKIYDVVIVKVNYFSP
jgi:hypothetical protein